MPSPKIIPAICIQCRKDFLTCKSVINADKGKFCSLSCSITHRNIHSKKSSENIFWSNVFKREVNECWIYKKCISTWGYGRLVIDKKFIFAHRFSYELYYSPIPEGMFVCHKCDNPPCVNPSHLFLGTCADNNLDKLNKNRTKRGSSHWKSKLNVTQVSSIREELKNGATGYELAKKYSVHPQTIYSIKYKDNWTWLKNV